MQPTAVLPRTFTRANQVFPVLGIWPWSRPVTVRASHGHSGRLRASPSAKGHIFDWLVWWMLLFFSQKKGHFIPKGHECPQM